MSTREVVLPKCTMVVVGKVESIYPSPTGGDGLCVREP